MRKVGFTLGVLLLLFGCKGQVQESCAKRLNQRDFASVAADEQCATWERASGELGLAGFVLSNLVADGATDNLRSALGIGPEVTEFKTWDGRTHYQNAQRLTGSTVGAAYEGKSRSPEDLELHFFANLGAILAQSYVLLDSSADGAITNEEILTATSLNSSSSSSFGQNLMTDSGKLQFTNSSGTTYLLDLTHGYCETDPNQDGVWGGSTASLEGCLVTTSALAQATGGSLSLLGSCAMVIQVDAVQNLFTKRLSQDDPVLDLSSALVQGFARMDEDLSALEVSTDAQIRQTLSDLTQTLDNGATCGSTQLAEVNQIRNLIEAAALTAQSGYGSYNKVALSTMQSSSDQTLTAPSFTATVSGVQVSLSCTNASNLDARMIYKNASGTGYVPYLEGATTNIIDAFVNLMILERDSLGAFKPTVAGDGIVSFKELLCVQ